MLLALQSLNLLADEVDDTSPDPFAFTNVTGAALSQLTVSNIITVSGLGSGISVPVNATTLQYSKNGGAYTGAPGTAENGDTFRAQLTSSASYSTNVSGTLEIGDQSDAWTVRTMSDPSAVGDFDFVAPIAAVGFIQ